MKSKFFVICLIGAIGVALFFSLRFNESQQAIHQTPGKPAVSKTQQSRSAPKSPLQTSHQPVVVPEAVSSNVAVESAEAVWLSRHSAGIAVNQTQKGKLYYPGTINVGGIVVDLGETPPLIHYQLKAKAGTLLLGELDDRHSFQRHLGMVRMIDGKPHVSYEVSFSYPRSASLGGFVFNRDDAGISRIGIIVPEIKLPSGSDASATQWAMSVRIGNHELRAEDLAEAMSQPIGSDTVLVMPTQTAPLPTTAQVLWLALDANGSFAVAHTR